MNARGCACAIATTGDVGLILDADTTEITRRNVPAAQLLDREYWARPYRHADGTPWCGIATAITEAGRAQLYVTPDKVTLIDKATRPLTDAEATALSIWIAGAVRPHGLSICRRSIRND